MVCKVGQAHLLLVVGAGGAPADGPRGARKARTLSDVWSDAIFVLVFTAVSGARGRRGLRVILRLSRNKKRLAAICCQPLVASGAVLSDSRRSYLWPPP